MPQVTIGIPFFNARDTLADAIRSVAAQTFRDWVLFLVDDGSRDGSLQIAQSVVDPRVHVLSDGKNVGLVRRLNQLAELAQTPFLARMDADDLMHPDRLEKQFAFLSEHRDIDLLGTGMISIDEHSQPKGRRGGMLRPRSAASALRSVPFLHPSIMGRTEWFRNNPYDPAYVRVEDGELAARTLIAGRLNLANLSAPLLFYREPHEFAVQKILATYRGRRQLIWQHGPKSVGLLATLYYQGDLLRKQLAWQILGAVGQQYHLIKRRNQPLTDHEAHWASEVIQSIQNQSVPGLCSVRSAR